MHEFRDIIILVIEKVIIPFLPIHIAGVFANMAFAGTAFQTLSVFGRVFALIIAIHLGYLVVLYVTAGGISGKNPFAGLKNMIPAYTTAVGTMSSAATIPVTLKSAKKNSIQERVADFVLPLCATVHLAGSTITLTVCAIAVVLIQGSVPQFDLFFRFIMMLGVTMIAAPGVPGGAVMAALGLLTSILGFGEGASALMIGLYLAQDSFGTAANVTGDGAIAKLVDAIEKKSDTAAPAGVKPTKKGRPTRRPCVGPVSCVGHDRRATRDAVYSINPRSLRNVSATISSGRPSASTW